MGNTDNPDRRRTLDEIGRAVADHLAALDRYEATFGPTLADPPPRPQSPTPTAAAGGVEGWAARLAAAEAVLAEQQAAWGRWQESLVQWAGFVQQPPAAPPT